MREHDNTLPNPGRSSEQCQAVEHDYVPVISQEEILRQLIADELKHGRLTRSGRKRLTRYATHLRFSALQVANMVEDCRVKALSSDDPIERRCAIKLVKPKPEKIPIAWKMSAVIACAIAIDLVVVWLM